MKTRKTIKPYLLIAVLLIAAAWVWLSQMKDNVVISGAEGFKKQELDEKVTGKSIVQIPVLIEEVKLTEKVLVKKRPKAKKKVRKVKPSVKPLKGKDSDNDKEEGRGDTDPNLFARYEIPVDEYLSYMRSKGARVLVYDKRRERFVSEVLTGGNLSIPTGVNHLSRRSRRITDDYPYRERILNMVERYYGAGSYEILLLLPNELEGAIYENLNRMVREKGLKMREVATVFMTYKGNASSVSVYVERVAGKFGTIRIGKTFRL